jgi:hypothetical protein
MNNVITDVHSNLFGADRVGYSIENLSPDTCQTQDVSNIMSMAQGYSDVASSGKHHE